MGLGIHRMNPKTFGTLTHPTEPTDVWIEIKNKLPVPLQKRSETLYFSAYLIFYRRLKNPFLTP